MCISAMTEQAMMMIIIFHSFRTTTKDSFFPLLLCALSSLPQNELQMALPNIDLSKLSKLRQRLVAPSSFSTQYLFPGNQAFFRDFIICCDFHMMFTEQLKIALISELLQMNGSSMETLSIARGNVDIASAAATSTTADDDSKEKSFQQEFIVSVAHNMQEVSLSLAQSIHFIVAFLILIVYSSIQFIYTLCSGMRIMLPKKLACLLAS
jgi:hypothetical protein